MKRIVLLLIAGIFFSAHVFADDPTNSPPVLTLDEAQQLALKNHPQIAAANYRALAAREVVKETRAGYFPNANLYADAVGANSEDARILAGGVNNPSIYDRVAGGLAVSQLITDFGHTGNLTASSKLHAEAASQNLQATREQVLLQVKVNYFNALRALSILQVARQTVDTRQLLLDQVSLLASNKLKSELDVSFAQVAVQEGQLLLQGAQNDADDAMTSLSTALGDREPRPYQLADTRQVLPASTNDVSQLVETALAQRPELLSLRREEEADTHFARSQRDARLPVVQAIGLIGDAPSHDSHLPDDYAVGGIQVSLPLFAGGLYTAREQEAEYKAEAEAEELRTLEDDIVRDVHIAWLNVNNAWERLQTTELWVRNANEAYVLAQARYQAGSSSMVELSQAQLSLTSAQINQASARFGVLLQQVNLDYETGTLR